MARNPEPPKEGLKTFSFDNGLEPLDEEDYRVSARLS
jgi:hypothetical protein